MEHRGLDISSTAVYRGLPDDTPEECVGYSGRPSRLPYMPSVFLLARIEGKIRKFKVYANEEVWWRLGETLGAKESPYFSINYIGDTVGRGTVSSDKEFADFIEECASLPGTPIIIELRKNNEHCVVWH